MDRLSGGRDSSALASPAFPCSGNTVTGVQLYSLHNAALRPTDCGDKREGSEVRHGRSVLPFIARMQPVQKPTLKPACPNFGSGPTAKRAPPPPP